MHYYHANHANLAQIAHGIALNPSGWRTSGDYLVCREALRSSSAVLQGLLISDWLSNGRKGLTLQNWVVEAIFEEVREREFPSATSRLDCWYVFASPDEALWYSQIHQGGSSRIYECEVQENAIQRVDMAHYDACRLDIALPIDPQIEAIRNLARLYYAQQPSAHPIWELLTSEPPIIRKMLSSNPTSLAPHSNRAERRRHRRKK